MQISAGQKHTCILKENASLECFGRVSKAELLNLDVNMRLNNVEIQKVSGGRDQFCILTKDDMI